MLRFPFAFFAVAIFSGIGAIAHAQVSVTLTAPTSNANIDSPARVEASGFSPNGMSSMAIFVDGVRVYFQWGDMIATYVWLSPGRHTLVVQGTDVLRQTGSSPPVGVRSYSQGGTISKIEDWEPWQSCTDSACAGGGGTSTTFTAPFQTSPSRDGSSRQFNLGGTGKHSNAYWYKFVGGSSTATNFAYDLWALVDNVAAPQALEFDVNQSFSQMR